MVLGINFLAPKLSAERKNQFLQQSINSIKSDEVVFITLLKKRPYYETDALDSVIRFGNPDSKIRLTVLSNPYCNPCAMVHKQIEELLKQVGNSISVQYILSSFGENRNSTNKFLIAACLTDKTATTIQIISDWFEKGRPLGDDYFKEWGLDIETPAVEVEFKKHEEWKKKSQLQATPTVLVNGYQLPESYSVEDLCYFTDFDL